MSCRCGRCPACYRRIAVRDRWINRVILGGLALVFAGAAVSLRSCPHSRRTAPPMPDSKILTAPTHGGAR